MIPSPQITTTEVMDPGAERPPRTGNVQKRSNRKLPISKTARNILRVATQVMARPKNEAGEFDISPLKSFEKQELQRSLNSESSPERSPLVTSGKTPADGVSASRYGLGEHSVETAAAIGSATEAGLIIQPTTSEQIVTGSKIFVKMSVSRGAGIIFIFFMLYSSVSLLFLSPDRANASMLAGIRVALAVAMAIFQQWPLPSRGMPHFVKFICCVAAFMLIGTLITGRGVDTGPGSFEPDANGITEETVVHMFMVIVCVSCSAPQNMGIGRIGMLSCIIALHLKNHFVDGDTAVLPHYGRLIILGVALLSSSYACIHGILQKKHLETNK